jgi:hypothetical protein
VDGDDIYAIGTDGIHVYDGASWTTIGTFTGSNKNAYSIGTDSDGLLYVCGGFDEIDSTVLNGIAVFDGADWAGLGSGLGGDNPYAYSLSIDSDDNVYVVGYFSEAGGVEITSAAKWNGTAWSAVGSDLAMLDVVHAESDGTVWAIGYWYETELLEVRVLTGNRWTPTGEVDSYIYTIHEVDSRVVVGGAFT